MKSDKGDAGNARSDDQSESPTISSTSGTPAGNSDPDQRSGDAGDPVADEPVTPQVMVTGTYLV